MSIYVSDSDLTSMPNVQTLQFLGSANLSTINFPDVFSADAFDAFVPGTPLNDFAATFTGQFQVSTSGSYTFCTASDDGSTLSVDGTLIVNNGGTHAMQTVCGSIALPGGVHSVYIDYFQEQGSTGLQVTYSGPDTFNSMVLFQSGVLGPTSCTSCTAGTYSSINGMFYHPIGRFAYFAQNSLKRTAGSR